MARFEEELGEPARQALGGQLRFHTLCGACGAARESREDLLGKLRLDFAPASATLEACLARVAEPETLDGVSCDACQQQVSGARAPTSQAPATRSCSLALAPPVLVLHLPRAQAVATSGRAAKVQTHIAFPLEGLSLAALGADGAYDLAAVVEHQGRGVQEGHYVAYTRHAKVRRRGRVSVQSNEWMLCNDARIESVPREQVQRA